MAPSHREPDYVLGHSDGEIRRLAIQAEFLRPLTEGAFRAAGIGPGQRVLDLGCGAGDVSFLVADLVGPTGSVVGIDRVEEVVAAARLRAECIGAKHVEFQQGTWGALSVSESFDAVVGRMVLSYQTDAPAALREAAACVRPSGVIIFQEADLETRGRSLPNLPLYDRCWDWLYRSFEVTDVPIDVGSRIYDWFLEAGLPAPEILIGVRGGGGPDFTLYEYLAETIRSLLPKMEEYGIASAEEVDIDTLAERLRADAVREGSHLFGPTLHAAWTRKP